MRWQRRSCGLQLHDGLGGRTSRCISYLRATACLTCHQDLCTFCLPFGIRSVGMVMHNQLSDIPALSRHLHEFKAKCGASAYEKLAAVCRSAKRYATKRVLPRWRATGPFAAGQAIGKASTSECCHGTQLHCLRSVQLAALLTPLCYFRAALNALGHAIATTCAIRIK